MNALQLCNPKVTGLFGLWRMMVLGLLLSFFYPAAHADIWAYVDETGVAHFAAERMDERYAIFSRAGESFDTDRTEIGTGNFPGPAATPAMPPSVASKVLAFFEVSPHYKVLKQHLREASSAQQIDYELLQALIATESGFDAMAVSPKGAIGLMQIMPATAARYGVTGDQKTSVETKLSDPRINIKTGSRYLSYLLHLFPGKLELALAAYNAGEGAVQRAGNKIPNYKETQNYVTTVMQLYSLLKPTVLMADKNQTSMRVRMQLQGGASNRGNMISSGSSMSPTFPESTPHLRN